MDETQSSNVPTARSIFLKATLLSLFFAVLLLIITALGVLGVGYYKLNQFAQRAQTTVPELKSLTSEALNTPAKQTNGYKTILLLGIDSVANKPGSPQLTDTMLLISVNMSSGEINTLSLPRDLWTPEYQTRINALYEYGKDRYKERPEQFPQEVIAQLIGVPVDHTIVLSLENVGHIIDIIGGIDLDVKVGFVDDEFPREDVDINTVDSSELYETVVFEPGMQHMDSITTLKYIRSRKSPELSQGTDVARSQRQQQVISAVVEKVKNMSLFEQIDTIADLYVYYTNTFESQFSKREALSTLNELLPYTDTFSMTSHNLSIFPENSLGVITHPPVSKYSGEWVYEIPNRTFFQNEVRRKLQSITVN